MTWLVLYLLSMPAGACIAGGFADSHLAMNRGMIEVRLFCALIGPAMLIYFTWGCLEWAWQSWGNRRRRRLAGG